MVGQNSQNWGLIDDSILPDAIKRLYIINVESAQNQLNLKEQFQTTVMLSNNYDRTFKMKSSHEEFKSKTVIKSL